MRLKNHQIDIAKIPLILRDTVPNLTRKMMANLQTNSASNVCQSKEAKGTASTYVPIAVCGMALRAPGGIHQPGECKLLGSDFYVSCPILRNPRWENMWKSETYIHMVHILL